MGTAPPILANSVAGASAVLILMAACSGGPNGAGDGPTDPAAAAAATESPGGADALAPQPADSGAAQDPETAGAARGDDPDGSGQLGPIDPPGVTGQFGPIDPLGVTGQIISEYSLANRDCFNRLEGLQSGRRLVITARVDCDEPHSAEVYHTFELDAPHPALYPGDDVIRNYALRVCYEHFEAFVGSPYELSVYEIEVFTPNRTNFEHAEARYRGVHCWLHQADNDPMTGTARATAR